jgi:hypothetical protein
MINHELKCVFIHIPRTAGSSISTAISQRLLPGQRFKYASRSETESKKIHISVAQSQKILGESTWGDYFKFAFVRNPWDRLVSQYTWRRCKNEIDVRNRCFKEWVVWRWNNWLSWLEKPRKVIRGNPVLGHRDKAVVLSRAFDEIYDEEHNTILVDFVGRFENLRADFDVICEKLKVNKKIMMPHKHKTSNVNGHYTEFYDNETKEIVEKFYRNDVKILGYKFGEN